MRYPKQRWQSVQKSAPKRFAARWEVLTGGVLLARYR